MAIPWLTLWSVIDPLSSSYRKEKVVDIHTLASTVSFNLFISLSPSLQDLILQNELSIAEMGQSEGLNWSEVSSWGFSNATAACLSAIATSDILSKPAVYFCPCFTRPKAALSGGIRIVKTQGLARSRLITNTPALQLVLCLFRRLKEPTSHPWRVCALMRQSCWIWGVFSGCWWGGGGVGGGEPSCHSWGFLAPGRFFFLPSFKPSLHIIRRSSSQHSTRSVLEGRWKWSIIQFLMVPISQQQMFSGTFRTVEVTGAHCLRVMAEFNSVASLWSI